MPVPTNKRLDAEAVGNVGAPHLALSAAELVNGLTHVSRNLLQRGRSAVERLWWRLKTQPDVAALLARARRSQEDLVQLFELARDLVVPPELDWQVVDVRQAWRD